MNIVNNLKILSAIALLTLISCKKEVYVEEGNNLPDWSSASHSNSADPNYALIFNQNTVQRIDLVLSEDEFKDMSDDLDDLLASSGGPGGGGPGGGGTVDLEEDPIYVAADFFYNGKQWYEVGLRYKGNSSLSRPYSQGIKKYPLRLKFDKYEDEYPEINNQRFYGFKDISMGSNFNDPSFMREKMATDLFREFGVPAPQTAFYEVWVDEGDGIPKYYGLYTMVEVVFDSMLEEMFGSNTGNCYKPDGDGARFGASGFSLDDFEKKTNEAIADWSDIQALYDALHSGTRTTNVEKWKEDLESLFDVNGFLKYLAVNNTIQNWDTYGNMTHNYYLYHDPADDLIKWIPWDNNEAFNSNGGRYNPLSFSMSEVSDDWPLISFLIEIPEYQEIYENHLQDFIDGPFMTEKVSATYSSLDLIISTSATSEVTDYTFLINSGSYSSAVSQIKTHASQRKTAVQAYLN